MKNKPRPCEACGVVYRRRRSDVNACPLCGYCDHGRGVVHGVCDICRQNTDAGPGWAAAAAHIRHWLATSAGYTYTIPAPGPAEEEIVAALEKTVNITVENHNDTLVAAQKQIEDNWHDGSDCPCCGQYVKLYRRKLNSSMARGLIELYRWSLEKGEQTWAKIRDDLDVPELLSRQIPTTRYWGLVERSGDAADDGNPSQGLYRLTDLGRAFVNGKVAVPMRAYVYNDKLRGRSKQTCTIVDALTEKFSYSELWEPVDTEDLSPLLMSIEWPPIMDEVESENGDDE